MEALLVAIIAGGVISATVHLIRRSIDEKKEKDELASAPQLLESPSVERSLEQLRPGDVVVYERRDMIVQEVIRCRDGDRGWWEYQLDEEGQDRWLIVDRSDQSGAILGAPAAAQPIPGEPPGALDIEGRIYRLRRCGQAEASVDGIEEGELGYWDYDEAGAARCWIRRTGDGPWRFYAGERTERHLMEVINAS